VEKEEDMIGFEVVIEGHGRDPNPKVSSVCKVKVEIGLESRVGCEVRDKVGGGWQGPRWVAWSRTWSEACCEIDDEVRGR